MLKFFIEFLDKTVFLGGGGSRSNDFPELGENGKGGEGGIGRTGGKGSESGEVEGGGGERGDAEVLEEGEE